MHVRILNVKKFSMMDLLEHFYWFYKLFWKTNARSFWDHDKADLISQRQQASRLRR